MNKEIQELAEKIKEIRLKLPCSTETQFTSADKCSKKDGDCKSCYAEAVAKPLIDSGYHKPRKFTVIKDKQQLLNISLISRYPYNDVKDVIHEALSYQCSHDQNIESKK